MKFMRFYKLKRSSNEFTTFNCNLRPETSFLHTIANSLTSSAITMQSIFKRRQATLTAIEGLQEIKQNHNDIDNDRNG